MITWLSAMLVYLRVMIGALGLFLILFQVSTVILPFIAFSALFGAMLRR